MTYPLRVSPLRLLMGLAGLTLLAWGLAFLPLAVAGLLICTAAVVLCLMRWPWLIWPALAVMLPVTSGLKPGLFSATEPLLALAVFLWFANGVRQRSLHLQPHPLLAVVAAYLAVLTLSALRAPDLVEAMAEVVKWLEFAIVLLLVPIMLKAGRGQWLAAALVVGATAQSVLGLYQFVNRIGPDWFVLFDRFMRASGSFRQPNPYAGYLGLTLPVAVSMALWALSRTRSDRGSGRWTGHAGWFTFYAAASALIAAGLLASWSRGGWLGALTGVVIVVILRSRRLAILGAVALLSLLAALLVGALTPELVPEPVAVRFQVAPSFQDLDGILQQPVDDDNFAVVERAAHWVAALRMWERAPWLGIGPGNYAVVYPDVRLPQWEDPLGHAHNVYLNVAAESGLLGLVALGALWVGAVAWLWRTLQQARRLLPRWPALSHEFAAWRAALIIGVLGVIGHLAVHSLVDNLFVQGMYLQVGLWLAIALIGDQRYALTETE